MPRNASLILDVRTVERVVVMGLEAVWVMVTVIFITVRMDEWRAMRSLLDNDLAIIATANAAHRHSPNMRPPDHRASVLPPPSYLCFRISSTPAAGCVLMTRYPRPAAAQSGG